MIRTNRKNLYLFGIIFSLLLIIITFLDYNNPMFLNFSTIVGFAIFFVLLLLGIQACMRKDFYFTGQESTEPIILKYDYCPYCGKENTTYDIFCSNCGKIIVDKDSF